MMSEELPYHRLSMGQTWDEDGPISIETLSAQTSAASVLIHPTIHLGLWANVGRTREQSASQSIGWRAPQSLPNAQVVQLMDVLA